MTQPPGDPYGPQPEKPRHTGRTVGLVLAVLAALVIVVVAVALIVKSNGDSLPAAGASSPEVVTTVTTTTSTVPTTTTTTTTRSTTTTTTKQSDGPVVYQLTGAGNVVALRYRNGGKDTVVPATGTPWSQSLSVQGRKLELNAIVLRGPVTCTILQGRVLLTSSTADAGPLHCAARLRK